MFSMHFISGVDLNLGLCPEYPEHYGPRSMSSESMWVLARSAALKYPELVPEFRFAHFSNLSSLFLPSEDILLALGLVELKHVKHSSWCNWNGRYQLIGMLFYHN
jgi:hypothetical protein